LQRARAAQVNGAVEFVGPLSKVGAVEQRQRALRADIRFRGTAGLQNRIVPDNHRALVQLEFVEHAGMAAELDTASLDIEGEILRAPDEVILPIVHALVVIVPEEGVAAAEKRRGALRINPAAALDPDVAVNSTPDAVTAAAKAGVSLDRQVPHDFADIRAAKSNLIWLMGGGEVQIRILIERQRIRRPAGDRVDPVVPVGRVEVSTLAETPALTGVAPDQQPRRGPLLLRELLPSRKFGPDPRIFVARGVGRRVGVARRFRGRAVDTPFRGKLARPGGKSTGRKGRDGDPHGQRRKSKDVMGIALHVDFLSLSVFSGIHEAAPSFPFVTAFFVLA
jgi:hypothetical protein